MDEAIESMIVGVVQIIRVEMKDHSGVPLKTNEWGKGSNFCLFLL
jgi:hypothetical protein